jgi:hypothetical protein
MAERRQVGPVEEEGNVAIMLADVVNVASGDRGTARQAVSAEGMFRQVGAAELLPCCAVVQMLPLAASVHGAAWATTGNRAPAVAAETFGRPRHACR